MKKILKFEVEEGKTNCENCPFCASYYGEEICPDQDGNFNCKKYDFSTLKFLGENTKEESC